uniref:Peptidase_M13 domain-containing protein n=2 Tax=Bursaphelenchus xylophilus TaxID=6326 RepID=A0A1I7S2I1_BURXY
MESIIDNTAHPCNDFWQYAGGKNKSKFLEEQEAFMIIDLMTDDSVDSYLQSVRDIRTVYQKCANGEIKFPEYSLAEKAQFAASRLKDLNFPIQKDDDVVKDEAKFHTAVARLYGALFEIGSYVIESMEMTSHGGAWKFVRPHPTYYRRREIWDAYCAVATCRTSTLPRKNTFKFQYSFAKDPQSFANTAFGTEINISDLKILTPFYAGGDEALRPIAYAAFLNELLETVMFEENYQFTTCEKLISDSFPLHLNKLILDKMKKNRTVYNQWKEQFFTYTVLILNEAKSFVATSNVIENTDNVMGEMLRILEQNRFAFFDQNLFSDDLFEGVTNEMELDHPRSSRFVNNLRVLLKYDKLYEHKSQRFMAKTGTQSAHLFPSMANFYDFGYFLFPLFDPSFPAVLALSSMGTMVGHEIAHTFIRMTEKSEAFSENRRCLLKLYADKCKPGDPNICVDPMHTYNENFADQLGTLWAYTAFKRLESRQNSGEFPKTPALGKLTNDQIFFLNFAQTFHFFDDWENYDPNFFHAPASVRIWAALANLPAFANAFECPGKSVYNPDFRCPMFVVETVPDKRLNQPVD